MMEVDFAVPAWLMWTLACVAAVVAYLAVGAVVAGIFIRRNHGTSTAGMSEPVETGAVFSCLAWPVAALTMCLCSLAKFAANYGSNKKG